ncbi:hypothetical protein EDB84DRAFT_1468566, partial [Lactarius hengduanensis]
MGKGAACPRAPHFRVNGEGWGQVACPRVPPSRVYGVGRRCRGRRGEGAACPRASPFRANREGWGRGRRALAYPLPARTGAARPMGKGGAGWRAACPLPARTGRRGQRGREGLGKEGEGGGGVPSYAPLLCEWAALGRPLSALERGRRSMRGKGKMREGATYPACD